MKLQIELIGSKEWEIYAEHAHRAVFNECMPTGFDRIDYALLAIDKDTETPLGYATVRELDQETAYLKHGGRFPSLSPGQVLGVYREILAAIPQKTLTTLIENTNVPYLKLAMKVGFRITGARYCKGDILCELTLERD